MASQGVSFTGLVCRVLAQDRASIFTWKNKCKIELEDHAKLSAYWLRTSFDVVKKNFK